MKITFVKKILKDGSPCRKCADVERRLQNSGYVDKVDEVLVADESDSQSPGMLLAAKHDVKLAPFFIVDDGDETRIYTVYFKFVKEELESTVSASGRDAEDTLRANPDLDYV